MCGFFYSAIFAALQTFGFGGKLPWWDGDVIEVVSPDSDNQDVLRLEQWQTLAISAQALGPLPERHAIYHESRDFSGKGCPSGGRKFRRTFPEQYSRRPLNLPGNLPGSQKY